MEKYSGYVLEDFVLDADFQRWVRYSESRDAIFWVNFKKQNPTAADDVDRAYALLDSLFCRYATDISDDEINVEIQSLVRRIRDKDNLNQQDVVEKRDRFPFLKIGTAAAVVLAVALGWFFIDFDLSSSSDPFQHVTEGKTLTEYINKSEENQTYTLSDGSLVVLEPGSVLHLPDGFLETSRDVFLSGTATFDVKKDISRPFTVYSEKLVTRVLGTQFIVRAPRKGQSVVEVKEGKVSVFKSSDFKKPEKEKMGLILTSNQKIVLGAFEDRLVKELSDTPRVIAAPLPPLAFDYANTPASEVLKDLIAAYQVDIIFDEEILRQCSLTATLSDQSLYEKLSIICEAIEAEYELIDGQVMIHARGCL